MRHLAVLALCAAATLASQTPDITGVWKADLGKSRRTGPPLTNYLVIIEQKNAIFNNRTKEEAPLITETTGIWNQRGGQRSVVSFFNNGKPAMRPVEGVPTRLTASSTADSIVVNGEVPGHGQTLKRTYTLAPGGQTLTLDLEATSERGPMHNTMVLLKQDNAAGEPLRQPEESAGKHFKNVKTAALKDLPLSEMIDRMHYFSWALGKDCLFCHVDRKFDSDDKKEKEAARKMVDMTAAINEHNFENKPAVQCFTCHEGRAHPLRYQMFADEIEAEKLRNEKEAAERAARP